MGSNGRIHKIHEFEAGLELRWVKSGWNDIEAGFDTIHICRHDVITEGGKVFIPSCWNFCIQRCLPVMHGLRCCISSTLLVACVK